MAGIIHGKAESHRRDQTKEISPTIIIGMGGTGKEVLLRLRQRFLEKYDTVGFPAIGYLWIDTDMRDINIDGKPIDYLDQEARFAPVDCIDAQVPGNLFQTYFNNMNQNQHIFSWMYHSVSKLGSVMNGARRIRPLGRLGFFHTFNTIQQRLANIKTRITSQQARDQTLKNYGIKINLAEIKVIICCSLAGGTGSGMFIDCAFLVRHLFKDESPDIVGYLLLPPVFSPVIENNEEIYANCFAALKELEFYSMRKDVLGPETGQTQAHTPDSNFSDARRISAHNFMVDWLNRGRPVGENGGGIVGPPFNTCYLVNNQTQTGGNIGPENKGDLIDMIAETIFIDFSTQAFSDKKRTIRSNLDDYLKNELEYEYLEGTNIIHSEIFSFRFSTFGLSMMYIPTDRVRKACAYLLGRDLVASWLKHNDVPGTLEEEIRKNVLGKLKLRVSRVADDFMAELQKNDDTGRTFFQEISTSWGEKEKAALRARIRSSNPNLMSEIERRKQAYAQSKLDRPKEKENWGAFVRRLELVNRKKFLESAQDFITGAVKEWLDKDNMRFQATIEYLQAITIILKKHKEFFENMSQKVKNDAEMIAREIEALKSAIDDEENGILGPHRWSLKALVDEICEKIALYFQEGIRCMIFHRF
ncbi:MAG: tubulin-like doman-containing protein, partial [Thermodesulfobacteriota bacterium]|nr:tubulin-like doman-containing protein [Thermodesulfobacteriota bacterium]